MNFKANVKRGAEWLDSVHPKWWTKVKLQDVDLELFEGCVIGQVFGADVSRALCDKGTFQYSHGFAIYSAVRSEYLKLSSAWVKEIEDRRKP